MKMLRLFIAFDTPPGVKSRAGDLRDRLKESGADVKWESNDKLHCTIKFLGDTNPDQVRDIEEQLRAVVGQAPVLSVRYQGLGCFPDRRDPRVVWIGVEDETQALGTLQSQVEDALSHLGFEKERRPFQAHLTLGRVKSRRNMQNLLGMLESITFDSEPVSIPAVELVKSDLSPGGSTYTVLTIIPLKA